MIRLKDIAARAGVTTMTVSKALRDAPDIAAATRKRIQELARELGYVPDIAARALRSGESRLLGLLIPSPTNPIFARIVLALEERAHDLGYELLLAHSLNRAEREETCLRRLLARRVGGLFISPVYRLAMRAPIYEQLRRRGVPTVILGQPASFCAEFLHATSDDLTGSWQTTRHLLELGHRRIACLTGQPVSPAAQERYEGYRRALREAGLPLDDRLVFNAGGTIEEGEKAALQMLNEKSDATAVVAVNDLVAIGAADVFLSQGLRVPADISVVGFGNILLTEHYRVPLTTVRQPKMRLGNAAADLMMRLLAGEHPDSRRLNAEMIVRASTAPPRARP